MSFIKKCDFTNFNYDDLIKAALEQISRYISKSEQSSSKIIKKLRLKGYPDNIIQDAIAQAKDNGIIDDLRYSESLIRSNLSRGRGLSRVSYEIKNLGIDIESIELYTEYMQRGEEEHIQDALLYLEKHPTRSKQVYVSSVRRLISRGFSSSVAIKAATVYASKIQK